MAKQIVTQSWHWLIAVSLLLLALLCQSCNRGFAKSDLSSACRGLGLCDDPPKAPVDVDILCDRSLGSSCTLPTLERSVGLVLPYVADRPGARLRLWVLGRNVGETRVVAEQSVPLPTPGSERAWKAQQKRFVQDARAALLTAAANAFEESTIRRSPLAEGLSKVVLAGVSGESRQILAITDGREVSERLDFECGVLPQPGKFIAAVQQRGLLTAGSLAGASINFAYVEAAPIPGRGCAVRLEREVQIQVLWTAALKAAGAKSVRIAAGPPVLTVDDTQRKGEESK